MIPNRPEEGGAQELEERRKKAREHRKKEKPEVEPTWAGIREETKGGD